MGTGAVIRPNDGDMQPPSGTPGASATSSQMRAGQSSMGLPMKVDGGYQFGYGSTISPPVMPAYLRHSRYAERLAEARRATLEAQANNLRTSGSSSNLGSLSTSSSSANLQRINNSHRGLSFDVVENRPEPEASDVQPLPSVWNEQDKSSGVELGGGNLEVRFIGGRGTSDSDSTAAAVRADRPMPVQCGVYYYEVTIISKGKEGFVH
jgi:hypothetical protein